MLAVMLTCMAGGMNRRDGHVAPIGVRAGMAEDPGERPWEFPQSVAPKDAHVMLDVSGEWVQALLVEQRREGERWVCRVAWADRGDGGTRVMNEWVLADRVRPRA